MALCSDSITFLHWDETYFEQNKLIQIPHEDIHLQGMSGTHLYCDKQAHSILKEKVSRKMQQGLTFLGSGDYHYMSYFLLRKIKEPFSLILFDNHPDIGKKEEQGLLSCGSWVSYALKKVPLLQEVFIIGATSILDHHQHYPRVTFLTNDKTSLHTALKNNIKTKSIYLSIDKDVLREQDAKTNWNQGEFPLYELISCIDTILKEYKVLGVDVCGEQRVSFQHSKDQLLNQQANLKLLQVLKK